MATGHEDDGDRIERLESEALASEAAELATDARIAELVLEVENLHRAMEHRAVIEQAKGVLMSSMKIGPDAAFAVLVAASQRENVKLRDIAARVVHGQNPAKGPDTDASSASV